MPESPHQSNKLEEQPLPKKQLELSDYPISEWVKTIVRLKPLDFAKFLGVTVSIITAIFSLGVYVGIVYNKDTYEVKISGLEKQTEKAEDTVVRLNAQLIEQQKIFSEQLSNIHTNGLGAIPPISKPPPSRWQGYPGFAFLAGTWQGDLNGFSGIKITIEPQDGDQVIAKLELKNTSCRMSLNLFQATDNMLTESEFFFRPTTASSGCPEIRNVMLRPNQSRSIIRITSSNDRVTEGFLFKKI